MIAALGWLWAWWCDPAEMMRQRRALKHWKAQVDAQIRLLQAEQHAANRGHYTTMELVSGNSEWHCECTCGWFRVTFREPKEAARVRALCDEHDEIHRE